jgi:hypothetical protein
MLIIFLVALNQSAELVALMDQRDREVPQQTVRVILRAIDNRREVQEIIGECGADHGSPAAGSIPACTNSQT